MKRAAYLLICLVLLLVACKKKEDQEEENQDSGSYPGRVKSINGTAWKFYYDENGLIKQYDYNNFGFIKTATVTWENSQVTCNDGIGYVYVRPRNAAGYALPGNNDQNTGNNWTYNSLNQLTHLNGTDYYWSNGNVDSLVFGTSVAYFEYSSDPETRNMGAGYVPYLNNFPVYNLNLSNLITKVSQYDGFGDTISIRLHTYTFDAMNRVSNETTYIISNGDTTYLSQYNYEYYE